MRKLLRKLLLMLNPLNQKKTMIYLLILKPDTWMSRLRVKVKNLESI